MNTSVGGTDVKAAKLSIALKNQCSCGKVKFKGLEVTGGVNLEEKGNELSKLQSNK